jgi:AraC-like DNA-binding protein/quercetin dioxygenase-like cupin family protein
MTIDDFIKELAAKVDGTPVIKDDNLNARAEPFTNGPLTFYPDGSKNLDHLLSLVTVITRKGSRYISLFSHTMPKRVFNGIRVDLEEGRRSETHVQNFIEFKYVAQGQLRKRIEDRDYLFKQGDVLFLNRDTNNAEYGRTKDTVVICLLISNSFFDKSLRTDLSGTEIADFPRNYMLDRKRDFFFIRFIPEKGPSQIPPCFENICAEFMRPRSGGNHILIGMVERFLAELPDRYQRVVEWNNHALVLKKEFEEVRGFLEKNYAQVTLEKLIAKFGHGINYYNRLIKNHTGLGYIEYLQNIRLEQAEHLLITTKFPVEDIAYQVGYKNLSHFYSLFYKKFQIKPKEMRMESAVGPSR